MPQLTDAEHRVAIHKAWTGTVTWVAVLSFVAFVLWLTIGRSA